MGLYNFRQCENLEFYLLEYMGQRLQEIFNKYVCYFVNGYYVALPRSRIKRRIPCVCPSVRLPFPLLARAAAKL